MQQTAIFNLSQGGSRETHQAFSPYYRSHCHLRVIGDTFGFLPQLMGSVPTTHQCMNKDTKDCLSWWTTSPPPQTFSTPQHRYFCVHPNTQLPLSYLFHEWEHLPGVVSGSPHSSIWLQTSVWPQPPRFVRVHQTVVSSASKVTAGIVSLLKGAKEEVPQSDLE